MKKADILYTIQKDFESRTGYSLRLKEDGEQLRIGGLVEINENNVRDTVSFEFSVLNGGKDTLFLLVPCDDKKKLEEMEHAVHTDEENILFLPYNYNIEEFFSGWRLIVPINIDSICDNLDYLYEDIFIPLLKFVHYGVY